MTYNDAYKIAKEGKWMKLPNFEGYFRWDYFQDDFIFINDKYRCKAIDLDVQNRTDFYYIT